MQEFWRIYNCKINLGICLWDIDDQYVSALFCYKGNQLRNGESDATICKVREWKPSLGRTYSRTRIKLYAPLRYVDGIIKWSFFPSAVQIFFHPSFATHFSEFYRPINCLSWYCPAYQWKIVVGLCTIETSLFFACTCGNIFLIQHLQLFKNE